MTITSRPVRKPKVVIKKAPKYGVVFFNNDRTNMDQVIYLLVEIFRYTERDAVTKMLEIHENDRSIVYTGSREACSMKNEHVKSARQVIHEENLLHKVELIEE